jgi:hypothetical protein
MTHAGALLGSYAVAGGGGAASNSAGPSLMICDWWGGLVLDASWSGSRRVLAVVSGTREGRRTPKRPVFTGDRTEVDCLGRSVLDPTSA